MSGELNDGADVKVEDAGAVANASDSQDNSEEKKIDDAIDGLKKTIKDNCLPKQNGGRRKRKKRKTNKKKSKKGRKSVKKMRKRKSKSMRRKVKKSSKTRRRRRR